MTYQDKSMASNHVQARAVREFESLHPTEHAEAYRDLQTWAGEKATEQEETNEREGVPERDE